ncbi:MAG: DUF1028 domain-containing protein [Candidatus Promineifilaceae bacterium]|nr:DUF1028 domain-containing protein [Candidatus Promineifilaceae bacterium]
MVLVDRMTGMSWRRAGLAVLVAGMLLSLALNLARQTHNSPSSEQQALPTNTWSIVAADGRSGDVGLAAASCVPNLHADAVGALVPGTGVAAIQALWTLDNRNQVFDMLQAGESAAVIVDRMSDAEYDAEADLRQYGIVTIHNNQLEVAAYTGTANQIWAGDQQNTQLGVTVQGNLLVGEAVVADAMRAFARDEPGFNTLPDRLMRALEAGSVAGGDVRCNNEQVTQTAATAFILVARGGDEPYAAENIGLTDAGTPAAPWLALSVAEPRFGPNPLIDLRRQYDRWRVEHLANSRDEGTNLPNVPALIVAVVALVALGALWIRRRRMNTTA